MTKERKKELKRNLAVMIDIAWRSCEFPAQELTSKETDYIQAQIDTIIARLAV